MFSLVSSVHDHGVTCGHPLKCTSAYMEQHVLVTRFTCTGKSHHNIVWKSSSELPGDVGYLVNERMHLAFIASGLIPEQYKKFSNFGCIRTVSSSNLAEKMPQFEGCVEALVQESIHQTIQEDQTESEEGD